MAARYTFQQLQDIWVQAGGSPTWAPMAAAIAMAESGGNPAAVNTANRNGSTDRGLWQINSIHGSQSTLDPLANARAAVAISKGGTDWRPWCTAWSNGGCGGTFMGAGAPVLKFLPSGTQTNTGVIPTAGTSNSVVTGDISPFATILSRLFGGSVDPESLQSALSLAGMGFRKVTYHIVCVVGGILSMIFGIVLLIVSSRTVQGVARARLEGPDVVVNVPEQAPPAQAPTYAPAVDPFDDTEPATAWDPPDLPDVEPVDVDTPAPTRYTPRHQQMVAPAGGLFRMGERRGRARQAVRGRDLGDPDELAPDPRYTGRHRDT